MGLSSSVLLDSGPPLGPQASNLACVHLPLQPSDRLNGRYDIVERLGSGQHSTVWLATDTSGHGVQVAIKVLTNEVTALQGTVAYELDVLQRIRKASQSSVEVAGFKQVLQLVDHFRVNGQYGDHLCLVTKVLGQDLLSVQRGYPGRRIPVPLVKHIARHMLRALAFVHDTCHVVHTDIKQDNILFDTYGICAPDLVAADVVLADFDTAVPEDGDHQRLIQPEALRSPEVILGCSWGVKADIWNMGCLIFELLTGNPLFSRKPARTSTGESTPEQGHFAAIYAILGQGEDFTKLIQFFYSGSNFHEFFDIQECKRRYAFADQPLAQVLASYNAHTPELESFLKSMLRIHPDDRSSAAALLQHPWLRT